MRTPLHQHKAQGTMVHMSPLTIALAHKCGNKQLLATQRHEIAMELPLATQDKVHCMHLWHPTALYHYLVDRHVYNAVGVTFADQ